MTDAEVALVVAKVLSARQWKTGLAWSEADVRKIAETARLCHYEHGGRGKPSWLDCMEAAIGGWESAKKAQNMPETVHGSR